MTKRSFLILLLLALVLPVNEMWQLWKSSDYDVNPWVALDYPLNIQWYTKFLFSHISNILIASAICILTRLQKPLKLAAITYFVYTIFDMLMFLVNFNKGNYLLVYACTGVILIIIAYIQMRRRSNHMKSNTYSHSYKKSTEVIIKN